MAPPQEPVTLSFAIQAIESSPWRAIIKDFEEKNPDIKIKIVEQLDATDQLEARYASSFKEGKPVYDFVYLDIIWVREFVQNKWLEDLSNWMSEKDNEELKEFLFHDVEGGKVNGRVYRIPFHSDVGVLYYRKALLDQIKRNPPETFDDLREISRKLKEEKAPWGYVWQGDQYEGLVAMFLEVLHGYGGFWINPETFEVGLDRPASLKAVKFLRSTINNISPPDVTTSQEERTRRLFQEGKAAFMRNWPYVWSLLNSADSPIQGKFDFKPMVHAKGGSSKACLGGWGLGIAANSKHKKEAWKAIQFFTSADTQLKYALETGNMPSRRALFTHPKLVERYGYYPKLLEIVEDEKTLVKRPSIPRYTDASKELQIHLRNVFTGQDPQKEMEDATRKTRNLLKSLPPQQG